MAARRNVPEIVIVGAGPVGLLFAARLLARAPEPPPIRILDSRPPRPWREDDADARVYALSRASQAAFAALGLWERIRARRASPYRSMRIFAGDDPDGVASIRFDAADIGEPDLGHIVEDSLLRAVLLEHLTSRGVDLRFGAGVASFARRDGRVLLTTADGETYRADLVVGADGTESTVRAAAGIGAIRHDYRQTAIVLHVASERPHHETAWQRFLPGGPLAFLPLGDGRSSIVWSCPADDAKRLAALDDVAFLAELQAASASVLGRLEAPTARHRFALGLLHATRYARPGAVLVGDAAHTVHPLAGQGMNLGLGDAVCLADTLARAQREGQYPGDEAVLRRYERARKAENLTMQLAFDALGRLFGPGWPAWARTVPGLGLGLVDRIAPAKSLLMRRALGLDAARANAENLGAA